MDQYTLIKTAIKVQDKTIREVSRQYGFHRQTIRKALNGISPSYNRQEPYKSPVMEPFKDIIEGWLEGDKKVRKKQRHTARRIYDRLVEECGFTGAESTVRYHVRKQKIELGLNNTKAFIPCESDIGREAEVDWGEADVIMNRVKKTVQLFIMRAKYSGKYFVWAYPHARQEMFFDGHIRAFHYFGGIFRTLVYDNLKTAVRKVLRGKDNIEQTAFIAFRGYYTFESRFCNPASGHEKGGVEGSVGYARRNYLVPMPEVANFEELNEHLMERCARHGNHITSGKDANVDELFEAERPFLLPLPESDYPVIKLIQAKADHYCTAKIDHNRYSVPYRYSGFKVNVELGVDKVCIYHNMKKIAEHVRVFGKSKWELEPFHYLELIAQRPASFEFARPVRQWQKEWPPSYMRLLKQLRYKNGKSKGTKEFIEVLFLLQNHDKQLVNKVIEQALEYGFSDAASIKILLSRNNNNNSITEALLPFDEKHYLAGYSVDDAQIECYGTIPEGGC